MTKEAVRTAYVDPREYVDKELELPMKWNTLGYDYLDRINSRKVGYHPGMDLNYGSGSDDFRFPVKTTVTGTIAYIGTDKSKTGWGNHLWIKEQTDMTDIYDNHLIQEVEDSGTFALVYKGKKHLVTTDRAGLASLTVQAREMPYEALSKRDWDSIPTGDNF